jgi:type II secretory pathway pseudopilin PulG
LTEIVIILGIVGIIISAILPLFVNVVMAGRSATYYSSAYKIADSKMEEYRNSNFDLIAQENTAVSDLPDGQLASEITNEIDGVNKTDIKRVEMTISWKYQRTQEIKIVTYIYRGGL